MECMSNLWSWFQTALDFLFPAECAFCGQFAGDDRRLIFCRSCWESISLISGDVCPRCGKPYASPHILDAAPGFVCGDCRTTPPFFERAYSAAYYEGVMREAIHQLKYYHKPRLAYHLIRLLVSHIPERIEPGSYTAVVPVPLHKSKQKQRGYNQAFLLARHLAAHGHLDMMAGNLLRIRDTRPQNKQEGRKARQENVKNAFQVMRPDEVQGKHLILIDDVLTTGATVNECAKMLKHAGAASVLVLTLSRAGFHPHD